MSGKKSKAVRAIARVVVAGGDEASIKAVTVSHGVHSAPAEKDVRRAIRLALREKKS